MKKLTWIFILSLAISCQKAELVERNEEDSRGNEEVKDTVNIDVIPEGWEGSIDAGFEF